MKSRILNTIVGIAVAAIFLFLALKNQPLNDILKSLLNAKIEFVILAVILYSLTFIARAEKWRIQVESLGYRVGHKVSFFAMILHYFANSFTIKLGGFVRCGNLKKNTQIPFSTCFGTYLSECIFDFLFLFLGLLFTLILQFEQVLTVIKKFFADMENELLHTKIIVFVVVFLVVIAVIVLFLVYRNYLIEKNKERIKNFLFALKSTFKLKKFRIFLMWQLVLWGLLFAMNYFLFRSLFDYQINFKFILTVTTFLYAAWIMPSPGGIGSVEYFLLQAFWLFNFSSENALSYGFLSNALTLFTTIFLGICVVIIQNLFTKSQKEKTA